MAAQTDSPTTPASAEKSVGSTLGSVSPPSDKSDHAEDSIVDVNLGTDGAKKENQDTKSSSAVSSVADNQDPASASDIDKKIRRAERFGITVQLSEQEKRNSRAERFGTSTPHGSDSSKKAEELKRKTRAERFGITAPLIAKEEEAKKKARLERFGQAPKTDAVEDDKRKARALRFSQPPSASPAVNGEGSVEAKATIAGKAGGGS